MKGIPEAAAIPVAAAFLIELSFYLFAGIRGCREWLGGFGRTGAASLMVVSAVAPWIVYSAATGEFTLTALLAQAAIAFVVSFWYVALPPAPIADILFLAVPAALYLSRVFDRIYVSPIPGQSISVLGKLMLIRTAALAILVVRGNVKADFRFLPNRGEWKTGMLWVAPALLVAGLVYWGLGLVEWRTHPLNALQAVGTFFGILWAVALPEEFFFRGLLQQWLEQWSGKAILALLVAAAIFGSAHLGFHRMFPNWRWAIVAAVLGVFLGLAWRSARSVQASMVTHAMVVTVWRVFLR